MYIATRIEWNYFVCERCGKKFLSRERCLAHENAKMCQCTSCSLTRMLECKDEECPYKKGNGKN